MNDSYIKLDDKFKKIKGIESLNTPVKGWIRAIRNGLGMTTTQLAKRLGVTQARVTDIEKDELKRNLKLSTLDRIAEAMGCKLVYALVPMDSLENYSYQQAKIKAKRLLEQTEYTMGLEDQNIPLVDSEKQLESLIQKLLEGSISGLWD